ncbi:MAG: hypothetical protein HYT79_11465 [Elusimicrobia bacterium]|nr:hypothetical protein [Elusimicrobiota bacterium]
MRKILFVLLFAAASPLAAEPTVDRRELNGQEIWEMTSEIFDGRRMLPVQVVHPVKPQVNNGLELERTYRIRTGVSVRPGSNCPDAGMCLYFGRRLVTREEWLEIRRYAVRDRGAYIDAKAKGGMLAGLGIGGGLGLAGGILAAALTGGLLAWILMPVLFSIGAGALGVAVGHHVEATKARSRLTEADGSAMTTLYDIRMREETQNPEYISPAEQIEALELLRTLSNAAAEPAPEQPNPNPVEEPGEDQPRLLPVPEITNP